MNTTQRFMGLFEGYKLAHGQYRVQRRESDGKMAGRAVTVSEPPDENNFKDHLSGGEYILGIIMLKEDNSCNFGVIDIDIRAGAMLESEEISTSPHKFVMRASDHGSS